jgi:opacity protein-like surface antigen
MKNLFLSAIAALLVFHTSAQVAEPAKIAEPAPVPQAQPLADSTTKTPARERVFYGGFSGGMMVHTGYITGGKLNIQLPNDEAYLTRLSGTPVGLGGVARIHIGPHVRIGGEGYISTLNYGSGRGSKRNQSHVRISWGGALVDYCWPRGKWTTYAGGTVGGGSFKNLTLFKETLVDEISEQASYRNYSFMVLAPFAGIEYAISDHISINVKADWMLKLTNRQPDFASGPRLYFGFAFYRRK